MIKAVIFDFDDTLFRSKELRIKAIQEASYIFYKIKLSKSQIVKQWGKPMREFVNGLYGDVDSYENIMKNYLTLVNKYPNEPYEDAVRTINTIITSYLVGVLSASTKELVVPELKEHKFPVDKFIYIQTAEDTDVHKPNPKVFAPTLTKLKEKAINPHEVIYIGDGLHDYYAAKNAGIHFIGIEGRTTPKKYFQKEGARTIKNLSELIHYLQISVAAKTSA